MIAARSAIASRRPTSGRRCSTTRRAMRGNSPTASSPHSRSHPAWPSPTSARARATSSRGCQRPSARGQGARGRCRARHGALPRASARTREKTPNVEARLVDAGRSEARAGVRRSHPDRRHAGTTSPNRVAYTQASSRRRCGRAASCSSSTSRWRATKGHRSSIASRPTQVDRASCSRPACGDAVVDAGLPDQYVRQAPFAHEREREPTDDRRAADRERRPQRLAEHDRRPRAR